MQSLTLRVIVRTVFGFHPGSEEEELRTRLRAMVEPLSRPRGLLLMLTMGRLGGSSGPVQAFERRREEVDELLYAEIDRRREDPELAQRDDVFSALLLARDEDGEGLSDREVRDELVTLLLAGHETTATGLAWTFDLLLHEPRRAGARARARRYVSRRGGQGVAARPPGDPRRRPGGPRGAVRHRALPDPAGGRDQPLHPDDPSPRRPLSRPGQLPSGAILGRMAPRTPTPGCRSAAARVAAWAPASP